MAIIWTAAEIKAVTDEAVRLTRTGKSSSLMATFAKAQSVLPKARRRTISTTSKVPWFVEAVKAAKEPAQEAIDAPQSDERQQVATNVSAAASDAPQSESAPQAETTRRHVVWKDAEKKAICASAAQLMSELQASSPRDALEKAQLVVLPPERRRKIFTMTGVADWYPDGLHKARLALRREVEKAIEAKSREEAEAAEKAAAATAPAVQAQPLVPVAASMPAPSPAFASILGDWTRVREHLVNEIASIVAEGIHRGLASVQLAPPSAQEDKPVRHVPFVADSNPKARQPSILVVGLKGGQVPQIKADFGERLDLRFCTSDQSKDQLRSMTEQADTTVAVVDFLSHSHTDIIKARSKHFIESTGGMTSLRQELARLAGQHLNGSAHAAG